MARLSSVSSAQIHEYTGRVDYTVFMSDSNANVHLGVNFRVQKSQSGSWLIETKDLNNKLPIARWMSHENKLILENDWTSVVFDSTNLQNKVPAGAKRTNTNAPVPIKRTYFVYPIDSVIAFNVDLAFPVWLALLSDDYFGTNTAATIPDFTTMGRGVMTGDEKKLSARISRQAEPDRSPAIQEIEFLNPGFYQVRAQDAPVENHPMPPPWNQEYVCALYQASKWNNVESHAYPADSRLDIFHPAKAEPGNERPTRLTIRTVITTTSARQVAADAGEFVPDPSVTNRISVKDYTRLTKMGTPLHYVSDKGFLKPDTATFDRAMKDGNKRALVASAKKAESKPLSPAVVWVVLALAGGVPLAAIVLSKIKTKNKTKKESKMYETPQR
jgi:hypothetical protein